VLTIEDDGVGIQPDDVPFVFKRFFRCAKHHSQEVKGTGLGLSIVKRAVEAHGGSIRLHSEPGKRTAFLITVPR
jgi:signal transduction histidine kinase